MDTTPIYTELQKTLIDPEADHWGTSAPPEFVASLDANAEQSRASGAGAPSSTGHDTSGTRSKQPGRSGGRRHRAED